MGLASAARSAACAARSRGDPAIMNTLDVQWGRYLSYSESRWSSHVDHTLPIRAVQIFRATPAARWRQYPGQARPYGACHLMADLAVKSLELIAPQGWHPEPAE